MITTIGWIGSFLFAICSIPQAWKSYKDGNASGISQLFIWFWFLGEIATMTYVLATIGFDGPLLVNYIVNIFFVIIIMRYMYFPRINKNE